MSPIGVSVTINVVVVVVLAGSATSNGCKSAARDAPPKVLVKRKAKKQVHTLWGQRWAYSKPVVWIERMCCVFGTCRKA